MLFLRTKSELINEKNKLKTRLMTYKELSKVNGWCILFMGMFFTSIHGFSQFSDTRYVIGTAGQSVTAGDGITYMFNIGEPAVQTAAVGGIVITQGFEQPPYERGAAPNPPVDSPTSISVNAFSPDGDGVNDVWIIPELSDFPENEVTIMNRWGDRIWSAENYDNATIAWDGKSSDGTTVANGTYFYVVKINNLPESFSGWVQVTK